MFYAEKEEIRRLTEDIIELAVDTRTNATELKKKVTGILSLISKIASYTNSKNLDMGPLRAVAQNIFYIIDTGPGFPRTCTTRLEIFCNIANSITFNFTKKGVKVNIERIDVSFFRT